jgi:Transmembrane amino acid transporter protein
MNSLVETEASGLLLPFRLEEDHDAANRHHPGQASQQDTIINLMKTCMGTGTLALPFAAAQGGFYLNTIGLLLIALWNLYSVQRLCHCLVLIPKDVEPPKRATTFGKVAWYAMGDAGLNALDGMMIILLFGIIVACKFSAVDPFGLDFSPPHRTLLQTSSIIMFFVSHRRRRRDDLY